MSEDEKKTEAEELLDGERASIVEEFLEFLVENKAYWLAPIILVILMLAGLVLFTVFTGGAAGPFIYTLF